MRGDSFVAQQSAGVRWLHVHPSYSVSDESWAVVRLAGAWRDGMLPVPGGVQDQPARLVAMIEIVLSAWAKIRDAEMAKLREK